MVADKRIIWCVPERRMAPANRVSKYFYIYMILFHDDQKLYIGISFNPVKRFGAHQSSDRMYVSSNIRPGVPITLFIIDVHDNREDAEACENLWIQTFDTLYPNGMNKYRGPLDDTERLLQHIRTRKREMFTYMLRVLPMTKETALRVFKLTEEEYDEYVPERPEVVILKPQMSTAERMEQLRRWKMGGPVERRIEKMYITADGLIRPLPNPNYIPRKSPVLWRDPIRHNQRV